MFALLREHPRVCDAPGAVSLPVDDGKSPLGVELRGVRFGFRRDRDVLQGFSLVVPPGTTCALVGGSGSGKSTVLRLLYRFYDVADGSVLIGGQDVRSLRLDSLRASIGVVPQDTVLFNDSIFRNIEYGKPGASAQEVAAAARLAAIHDTILAMPDGYETVVGERGLKLSGGEKQRVALARAFLKSPRIMMFDEATSAMDSLTETSIMESLKVVAAGRTTLFIAHRLTSAMQWCADVAREVCCTFEMSPS